MLCSYLGINGNRTCLGGKYPVLKGLFTVNAIFDGHLGSGTLL